MTFWGIVALACWGIAVLSANLSGLVPREALVALHAPRHEGGTVAQLGARLAALELETDRLRRERDTLAQRFELAERSSGEVTRRVGALEVAVPRLLEQREAAASPLDSTMTGAIGTGGVLSFETDGGSVSVQQKPLVPLLYRAPAFAAVPAALPVAPDAMGLALGFPVAGTDAEAQWQSLTARIGTLLIGMSPLLQEVEGSDGTRIVAGPLSTRLEAEELCGRMDRVGIPCTPVPYSGAPLPLLN